MTKLSPDAQAVLDASINSRGGKFRVVAALRAIAEVNVGTDFQNGKRIATILRSDILKIADEIEAS